MEEDAATPPALGRSLVGLGQSQIHTGASQGLAPNPSPGPGLGLSTELGLCRD